MVQLRVVLGSAVLGFCLFLTAPALVGESSAEVSVVSCKPQGGLIDGLGWRSYRVAARNVPCDDAEALADRMGWAVEWKGGKGAEYRSFFGFRCPNRSPFQRICRSKNGIVAFAVKGYGDPVAWVSGRPPTLPRFRPTWATIFGNSVLTKHLGREYKYAVNWTSKRRATGRRTGSRSIRWAVGDSTYSSKTKFRMISRGPLDYFVRYSLTARRINGYCQAIGGTNCSRRYRARGVLAVGWWGRFPRFPGTYPEWP